MKTKVLLLILSIIYLLLVIDTVYAQPIRLIVLSKWNTPLSHIPILLKIYTNSGEIIETNTSLDYGGVVSLYIPNNTVKLTLFLYRYNIVKTIMLNNISSNIIIVKVDELALINIRVLGLRHQGLEGAMVFLNSDDFSYHGYTDETGCVKFIVFPSYYNVTANYNGIIGSSRVLILPSERKEVSLELDVWIEILNNVFNFEGFMTIYLSITLGIILLFILLHEYSVWRRKKIMISVLKVISQEKELERFIEFCKKRLYSNINCILVMYRKIIGFNSLSKKLFEVNDGGKFEEGVTELLRLFGFYCIHLGVRAKKKQGELDIIALDAVRNIALIIECKSVKIDKGTLPLDGLKQIKSLSDKYKKYLKNKTILKAIFSNARRIDDTLRELLEASEEPIYIVLRDDLEYLFSLINNDKVSPEILIGYLEKECKYPMQIFR